MWAVLLAAVLGITTNAEAYLHPKLGRFVQRDREGYIDGMSLYEYVASEPVGYVDPSGLKKTKKGERKWPKGMPTLEIRETITVTPERKKDEPPTWFSHRISEEIKRKFKLREITTHPDEWWTPDRFTEGVISKGKGVVLLAPNAYEPNPIKPAGRASLIAAWKMPDDKKYFDGKCCDFSHIKWRFAAIIIDNTGDKKRQEEKKRAAKKAGKIYSPPMPTPLYLHAGKDKRRVLRVKDGKPDKKGMAITLKGSRNVWTHERWHTDGLPKELYEEYNRIIAKGKLVGVPKLPRAYLGGFKGAAVGLAERAKEEFAHAINRTDYYGYDLTEKPSEASCRRWGKQILDEWLIGGENRRMLLQIMKFGAWHLNPIDFEKVRDAEWRFHSAGNLFDENRRKNHVILESSQIMKTYVEGEKYIEQYVGKTLDGYLRSREYK